MSSTSKCHTSSTVVLAQGSEAQNNAQHRPAEFQLVAMAPANRILVSAVLAAATYSASQLITAFVASPAAASSQPLHLRPGGSVALQARGGGDDYPISDADIEKFYAELTTGGSGGDAPKGQVVTELIVKFFHGEYTPQGFKRYAGFWKGPPPGNIGKKDIAVAMVGFKEQMKNPMFPVKAGVGYGTDEMDKVIDDGKGWVWLAAEMSPGGLAVDLFTSVPYGKRALLVAKRDNVDEMFAKVNWDVAVANIEKTFGGPLIKQR
jgi:hypothetical protein